MRFLLGALLVPFVLCCDSPSTSPSKHAVQIQLHKSQTTTTYLNPLDLKSSEDLPELLPYGFIINTNEVIPRKIIVKDQLLNIPKNAKALLLTLPKHQEEKFCQDVQITSLPNGLQFPEFQNIVLKETHVPIYLQFTATPVQVKHIRKQRHSIRREKEEDHPLETLTNPTTSHKEKEDDHLCETLSPVTANDYSKKELKEIARNSVRVLFNEVGERTRWPFLAVGKISAINFKGDNAQVMQPRTQTANKILEPKYFSIPYSQNDDYTFIRIQKKIINLTRKLKGSMMNKYPHLIIEMEIVRKESDESIKFPHRPFINFRYATVEDFKNLPDVESNHCNIYFQFKILKNSTYVDFRLVKEEESNKSSPKPRRHSCIGTSPWPKPYSTYKTF